MGRGYYNLVIKAIFSLFVVCAFYQCTPTPPQFEEMVGVWKAKDGAVIELNADSTFVIKNFDSYFFHELRDDTIRYKVNAVGKWSIWVNGSLGNLLLSIGFDGAVKSSDSLFIANENKWIISPYSGDNFYIKGEGGFLTDKAPWFIRAIDNFDDYNTYDFHRVK
ncbi:hypothetical protein [Dysgonomonas sp. GY617]|uniref:hypothetical protein n=1 Tax=Dysgonomonas sp. GY617 TaxID=2780420 RepID=UPI0018840152|nr:hypothetical protein [Dysgonomonas sp. GY617]MBF0575502.1 hypothetical protein [Dysgonomonas sp. GY617]